MASDSRAHRTVLSPPPLYQEYSPELDTGFDAVHFYGRNTPSDGSMYSNASIPTATSGRRPSDASHFAPSAFRDRRFSDASNVLPLPIEIDHRQRSSSGSSGSHHSQDRREQREQYPDLYVAAGLPTPPGSSIHSVNRSPNGNLIHRLEQMSITEQDDPAVIHALYPSTHSPLSAPHSPRNFSNPHSPLLAPRPIRQQSFQQLQVPCTCTFYELANATMVLCPPGEVENQTPLYTFHVSPSCFQPMSFITTVKRGGPGSKQLIARFEMGMSRDPPTLLMDNIPYQLHDVFFEFRKVKSKLKQDRWRWVRGQYNLHWYYSSDFEAICHHDSDQAKTPLATLISAAGAHTPGTLPPSGQPMTRLMVMTPNQALLDEIVVSALLVERKRLTPIDGNQNKDLFN
ncbi:hypothetical protein BC629DRAFT_813521 [Irpex lacteus]|nr:hypothetical protein BC629DRAFT_813521 [Irpex lacteus]